MNHRIRGLALLAAAGVVIAAVAIVAIGERPLAPLPSPARAPMLPDLAVLPLFDFLVGTDEEGGQVLRFSTTIENIGPGPLMIRAERTTSGSPTWRVAQLFREADGSQSATLTAANLVFGGHGHDHWHIAFGASYHLLDAGGGEVRSQTKAGYCFFDQVVARPDLAGPSPSPGTAAGDCGEQGSVTVRMGLSPGWSDPYFWQLEDQTVDITGLSNGRYRVTATADPDGWLTEADETNNETWAEIELAGEIAGLRTVEVVDSAGAAEPQP
jgi:hypothetical protein